jgi:hypothetical protein
MATQAAYSLSEVAILLDFHLLNLDLEAPIDLDEEEATNGGSEDQ